MAESPSPVLSGSQEDALKSGKRDPLLLSLISKKADALKDAALLRPLWENLNGGREGYGGASNREALVSAGFPVGEVLLTEHALSAVSNFEDSLERADRCLESLLASAKKENPSAVHSTVDPLRQTNGSKRMDTTSTAKTRNAAIDSVTLLLDSLKVIDALQKQNDQLQSAESSCPQDGIRGANENEDGGPLLRPWDLDLSLREKRAAAGITIDELLVMEALCCNKELFEMRPSMNDPAILYGGNLFSQDGGDRSCQQECILPPVVSLDRLEYLQSSLSTLVSLFSSCSFKEELQRLTGGCGGPPQGFLPLCASDLSKVASLIQAEVAASTNFKSGIGAGPVVFENGGGGADIPWPEAMSEEENSQCLQPCVVGTSIHRNANLPPQRSGHSGTRMVHLKSCRTETAGEGVEQMSGDHSRRAQAVKRRESQADGFPVAAREGARLSPSKTSSGFLRTNLNAHRGGMVESEDEPQPEEKSVKPTQTMKVPHRVFKAARWGDEGGARVVSDFLDSPAALGTDLSDLCALFSSCIEGHCDSPALELVRKLHRDWIPAGGVFGVSPEPSQKEYLERTSESAGERRGEEVCPVDHHNKRKKASEKNLKLAPRIVSGSCGGESGGTLPEQSSSIGGDRTVTGSARSLPLSVSSSGVRTEFAEGNGAAEVPESALHSWVSGPTAGKHADVVFEVRDDRADGERPLMSWTTILGGDREPRSLSSSNSPLSPTGHMKAGRGQGGKFNQWARVFAHTCVIEAFSPKLQEMRIVSRERTPGKERLPIVRIDSRVGLRAFVELLFLLYRPVSLSEGQANRFSLSNTPADTAESLEKGESSSYMQPTSGNCVASEECMGEWDKGDGALILMQAVFASSVYQLPQDFVKRLHCRATEALIRREEKAPSLPVEPPLLAAIASLGVDFHKNEQKRAGRRANGRKESTMTAESHEGVPPAPCSEVPPPPFMKKFRYLSHAAAAATAGEREESSFGQPDKSRGSKGKGWTYGEGSAERLAAAHILTDAHIWAQAENKAETGREREGHDGRMEAAAGIISAVSSALALTSYCLSAPIDKYPSLGGSGLVPVHDTLHGAHPLASRVKDTETGKDEEGGGSGNLPSRSSSFVWGRRLPIALPLPLRAPVEGSEEQANKENDAGLMLLGRVKETEGERQTATSPSPQRRNLMRWGALAILSGCGGQGEPRKETGGDTVDIVEMGGVQGEPRLAATFRGPSGSPASYVVTTTGQLGFLQGDSHRGDEENLTNSGKNKGELRVRVVDVNYFPGLSLSQHAPSAASTPANARLRETASLVCCGESHAIVVTVTGRLFSWGSNFFCQQGNGVRSLEGGTGREGDGEDSEGDGGSSEDRQSSSVLSERGEIGGWEGTESVDMYGGSLGSAGEEVLSLPLGDRVAVRAACGKFHTVVALADGSVWHWGAVVGSSGPLVRRPARCPLVQPGGGGERAGDDGDSDMIPAHSVRAGPSVRFLSAGDGFSVAVTARPPSSLHGDRESRLGDSGDSGESSRSLCWDVFCWGVNEKGQLGLSDLKERESPTRLPLLLLSAASGEEKKISPDDEEGRGYLEEFSAIFNKGDRTIVGMDSGPSHSVILVRREIGNHFQEEKNEGGAQNGASPLSVSCGGEEEASPSPSQSPAGPSSDILEVLVWGGGGMPGPAREEAKTLKVPRLESAHSLLRPQVSSHFEAEAAFSVAEEDKKKQAVKEDTEESAEAEEEEEEESADPHIALALASPSNPAAAGAQKMAILIPPGTTAPSVQCWRSDTFILVGAGLDASSTDATSPTSPFPFKVAIEGVEGQGGSEREREKGSRERERFQQAKSRSFWKEAAGSRIHRMQRLQRHFHLKTMPALSPTSLSSPEEGAGNEQAAYVDLALSRQARIQRGDEETHANDSSSISLSVTAPPQTDNDRRTGARGSIVSVVSAPPDSHRQAQTDHSSLGGAQVTRCPHCKASVPLPPTTIGTARSQNSDDGGFSGVPSAAPVSIGVQQVATHRPHASKRLYIRQEGEVEGGLDRSAHAARDKEKRDKEKEGGGIFWKILSMLKGDEEQDGDGGESSQVKARRSSLLADTPGEKDQAEGPQWAAGEGDADRQNRRASVLLTKQFVLQVGLRIV
uniref:Uncharacterized protein n=1 Tax=Chromera velia CCMP2878 TaxID=1169474 RepID=A0A0G4HVE5_9ALVE|eukprot:Cvel_8848.t1-p1 / transcript=Cvel_8848.t1 / gene=Cvel_8848 / organism=Chromera_velia_CCMP2878 / gene_product=hypothetical protein / transcript_product=hypothetical protein / location=Cvel_scaffold497:395-17621(-) / protein_length=2109 / sequence_SO=supercontig / SO=protein_coding / is_pseudo=false